MLLQHALLVRFLPWKKSIQALIIYPISLVLRTDATNSFILSAITISSLRIPFASFSIAIQSVLFIYLFLYVPEIHLPYFYFVSPISSYSIHLFFFLLRVFALAINFMKKVISISWKNPSFSYSLLDPARNILLSSFWFDLHCGTSIIGETSIIII